MIVPLLSDFKFINFYQSGINQINQIRLEVNRQELKVELAVLPIVQPGQPFVS
jgi:hypothetical protein